MDKNLAMPSQVLQERKEALQFRSGWQRLLITLAVTLGSTLLVFGAVFGLCVVRGNSMYPTFKEGDLVLYCRVGGYHCGDVVILRPEKKGEDRYVKRVLGLPGDTVDIDSMGRVIRDGEPMAEPYASGHTRKKEGAQLPLKLGKKEYFVLGDNRQDSKDSRDFGPVLRRRVRGKVLLALRGS